MSRYDWPKGPRRADDHAGRVAHLATVRPAADPDKAFIVPPTPKRRARSRAVPKNAPAVTAPYPWIPIGPSVTVGGQASGNPNVAGRIRDLRVDSTGNRAYAASASGGVWYTDNRGASWRPLDAWQESPDRTAVSSVANALACGSLWVKWNADPTQEEVWVGTGELAGGADMSPSGEIGGVGFLRAINPTDPASGWTVVKGDAASADATTLRGQEILRITEDPGDHDVLIAGTTRGVYVLGSALADWTRIPANMPDNLYPVDVVVTRNAGKVRVWVACYSTLLVAEVTPPLTADKLTSFTAITLPEVVGGPAPGGGTTTSRKRLQIAASPDGKTLYVLGQRYPRTGESVAFLPAQLWTVDATASISSAVATVVNGLPVTLFTTNPPPVANTTQEDQANYDMAITAHPTTAGRIFVGGCAVQSGVNNDWNGAVYRCDISGANVVSTPIGDGVHADDHVIRVAPGPTAGTNSVWVGCDGGLFRSDNEGNPGTFVAANDGLAVLQPGYVASHPTNPGLVVAGFQDNGTALRVGDTVWLETFEGDGGGAAFHPSAAARYVRQYINATWRGTGGAFVSPVFRGAVPSTGVKSSETEESKRACFYSGAEVVEHGGRTHLAIGTHRVWYSDDFGATWVTLPTGTDPRPRVNPANPAAILADNPNISQDALDVTPPPAPDAGSKNKNPVPDAYTEDDQFGVLALKFARPPNVAGAAALRLLVLNRKELVWYTATQLAPAAAFSWVKPTAATPIARQVFRSTASEITAGASLAFLPAQDIVSDLAVHDPTMGELGSCYVTTIGRPLFSDSSKSDSHIDTLWFFDGHATWYPTGLRLTLPAGNWGSGTRVTAPALGVVVDPEHPEIVYVGTSVGVVKGTLTIAGTNYSWQWEQFMNGLPEGAVQDLSIHWYPRPPVPQVDPPAGPGYNATAYAGIETPVKLLRAALQARGVWEVDLATPLPTERNYLRTHTSDTRRRLPSSLDAAAKPSRGEQSPPIAWDASPDIVIDTSGTAYTTPPTEAGLRNLPRPPQATAPARFRVANRHPVVHVLVHRRWPVAAAKDTVRIVLLRHALPANGVVALGGLWPALITASHAATPPATLPVGWTAAGATLWQKPVADVDVRTPQSVSFTLDWTNESPKNPFVLLAVVMVDGPDTIGPGDLTLAGGGTASTVAELVTTSAHCAAVTVRVM